MGSNPATPTIRKGTVKQAFSELTVPLFLFSQQMTVMNKSYHKEILHIALPSILSNITVPLLGLIDLTIAGHLGAASYIGAIAIGGTIFNMIYWIFAFLRMGTSGMTSQAYGADNKQEMQLLLYRSLATSTGIAILILLLQGPLLHLALSVMSPTEAVADFASVYFRICVWGAPAVLGLYSMTGWFIGLQNAKYPLYVAIVQKPRQHSGQPVLRLRMAHGRGRSGFGDSHRPILRTGAFPILLPPYAP